MVVFLKKEETFQWTNHSKQKMRYYRLSESRVKGVLRQPSRVEEGIAPDTLAAMQFSGTRKHPKEIWVMYVIIKNPKHETRNPKQKPRKIKVISTWRYPGITPKGQRPIIPQDILRELNL